MNKNLSFVSVIVIEKDIDRGQLKSCITNMCNYLFSQYADYELVVIEEGYSKYNQRLWEELLSKLPSIRVIQVSNCMERELAFSVGLENAIGDHVVLYNPIVDPVNIISLGVDKNNQGYDIVGGINQMPNRSFPYKLVRPLINKVLTKIGYIHEKNTTDFYCLSRNAVNSITIGGSKKYNLRVKISQCYLKRTNVTYIQGDQCEFTKKTLRCSIPYVLNMVVFNSVSPLKYMAMLGAISSMFSLVFASYSLLQKIFSTGTVEGWTSIIMLISLLFTILFVILSFISEYLSRLLDETNKGRPYWITNELNSNVMVDEKRYNVLESSQ